MQYKVTRPHFRINMFMMEFTMIVDVDTCPCPQKVTYRFTVTVHLLKDRLKKTLANDSEYRVQR